jgi:hypothetical protein
MDTKEKQLVDYTADPFEGEKISVSLGFASSINKENKISTTGMIVHRKKTL